ncbi:MAG: DUF72 domain-containing protein [Nitrospiraceae bacterium]
MPETTVDAATATDQLALEFGDFGDSGRSAASQPIARTQAIRRSNRRSTNDPTPAPAASTSTDVPTNDLVYAGPDGPRVRFGTSSWAYEGWKGQIYQRDYSEARFSRESLAEYATYAVGGTRLFGTVGVDHSFYRPPTRAQWQRYADLVPDDFQFCLKVWEELTIPTFAAIPRYGDKQGTVNPRFLDATLFTDMVAGPTAAGLGNKLGVFLFEFQRTGIAPELFLDRLEGFLSALPHTYRYAVEIREQTLLNAPNASRYRAILERTEVAHVYNHWTAMPSLADQHRQLGGTFTAPTVVTRLLTPRGVRFQTAVDRYKPYNRLVAPIPTMRDDAAALIEQAVAGGRRPYVLVNNRSEGNSPLTIKALVTLLKSRHALHELA